MVDDVLINKAATIERCVQRAREEYFSNPATFATNFSRQDAAILNIQRACEAAIDMAEADLNQHLSSSYGIFSGPPKAWATILFSAEAARWAAEERWHSQQQGQLRPDGSYELRLPYSNSRELLMDVLRYGPDDTILEPPSLRSEAQIQLRLALGNYAG